MQEKVDHSNLIAQPEQEDFKGKYENNSFIANYLVDGYFKAVRDLISKINISTAHEIGAGEGFSTMRLKHMVNHLTASEYVDTLLNKTKANNPDIEIAQESVYDVKLDDESVDLVFLLEVLEHLDHPEVALSEIKRVTNKYLILGVPREPLWRLLNMIRLKYLSDFGNTPGHLNHWSKTTLVKFIENNFGKVIAIKTPLPWIIVLAEKQKEEIL